MEQSYQFLNGSERDEALAGSDAVNCAHGSPSQGTGGGNAASDRQESDVASAVAAEARHTAAPAFALATVKDQSDRTFGFRLFGPQSTRLTSPPGGPSAGADNLRALSTAIRVLSGTEKKVRRLLVEVETSDIGTWNDEYFDLLDTVPAHVRAKLYFDVSRVERSGKDEGCEEFAQVLRDNFSVPLVAWTDCSNISQTEGLIRRLDPSILGIDRRCVARLGHREERIALLDVMELAADCGARVLAAGVDRPSQRAVLRDLDVELMCGAAIGSLVELAPTTYQDNVARMADFERRRVRT